MKRLTLSLSWLCILLISLSTGCTTDQADDDPSGKSGEIVFSGTLLAADDTPLPGGTIKATNDYVSYTTHADEYGKFRMEIDQPGMYDVYMYGAGHKTVQKQLFFGSTDVADTRIRLQAADLPDETGTAEVVVAADNESAERHHHPMDRVNDGQYTATIPISEDSLFFYIAVEPPEVQVAPPSYDRYVPDMQRLPRADETHPFFAVAEVPENGESEITFDPDELYPPDTNPEFSLDSEEHSQTALYKELTREYIEPIETVVQDARDDPDREVTDADISGYITDLREAIDRKEGFARKLLMANYTSLPTPQALKPEPNPEYLDVLLNEVHPSDVIWTTDFRLVMGLEEAASQLNRHSDADDYISRIYETTFSEDLQAHILASRLFEADRSNDEESIRKYYDKLASSYPGHRLTNLAEMHYSPDRAIQSGNELPDFEVASLDEPKTTYSKKSLKGKAYLMDFWATWCGVCIADRPHLEKLYQNYKDDNFTIVSFSLDNAREDLTEFREKEYAMPWKHTFVEGGTNSELTQRFEVTATPTLILVDEHGIIQAEGRLRGEQLDEAVSGLLD